MREHRTSHDAWIALGANLDDPVSQVESAIAALGGMPGTQLVAHSSLYRSAPWGYADQPDFVNAVARVSTQLAARELLAQMLALEDRRGRVRSVRNGPRTLDLDLLLYDDVCIDEPELVVPHPRMHERAFVLVPLLEVDPDAVVPGRGRASELARALVPQGLERIVRA